MDISAISLFSGAGGLDIAAERSGIRTVCRVEWDRYAQAVLVSRIRDGQLGDAALWDDVSSFDGKPWAGKVDIVFGGFPCQDLSAVGHQEGIGGGRSGLWKEFARIIREVGPRFVLVENVPGLLVNGALGVVLGDLASMGFDARWQVLSARSVGAPHERERVFIVADRDCFRRNGVEEEPEKLRPILNRKDPESPGAWSSVPMGVFFHLEGYRSVEREGVLRMDDGLAENVDGIRCCGNGVVPDQAEPFFGFIQHLAGS